MRWMQFESFVNLDRCQTGRIFMNEYYKFESFVNLDRCQTVKAICTQIGAFESFVNLDRCQIKNVYKEGYIPWKKDMSYS